MNKQQKIRNKIVDLKIKIDELEKEITALDNKELFPLLVKNYLDKYFTYTIENSKYNLVVVYIHITHISDDCIMYGNNFTVCENEYSDIVFDEKVSRAVIDYSREITKESYTLHLHEYLKQIALDYPL